MLNKKEIKFGLKDISIVQSTISNINSRGECNPLTSDGTLPLFTAPMSSVVDLNNYKLFKQHKINPIIPRTVDLKIRKNLCKDTWCAFSLSEFEEIITLDELHNNNISYVLIDIAHGGMKRLHDLIINAKESYGNKIKIMAGNVANPMAYKKLSESGCDFIRVGIGGGAGCITSSNTGVHFPMASLIAECYEISCTMNNPAYIVADGGIRGFSDINKSLALGADYVMCGSIFNKMLESSGETIESDDIEEFYKNTWNNFSSENIVDQYNKHILSSFKDGNLFYKAFYGMSTKRAQKELGNTKLKTSEGIEKMQRVEYTMEQWVENFKDYLKSAMSYTNCYNLYDFIGEVETIVISESSQASINK